jgi:Fe-S oxidoreductase
MSENKSENQLKNLEKVKDAALSCVHCGQCRVANWPIQNFYYVCPVYKSQVSPQFDPYFARGKNIILKGLLWGDLKLSREITELFSQCSLCGACEEFCHNAMNENFDFPTHRWTSMVEVFEALRADLVEAGFALDSHSSMNKALTEKLNPYDRDNKEKSKWTDQLDFKVKDASKKPIDLLYYVGCTAALTPNIQNIAIYTSKILHKLGIDFGILGEHEICCGSVALRTGDRKAFETISEKNVELLKRLGIKTIITSCAGCYRTLKKDYNKKLDGIEIFHTVEFLQTYLQEKEISLKNLEIRTTYHDPCHIGRHMGMYEIPREVLAQISDPIEMQTNREGAMCCGAGGGLRKGNAELSLDLAKNRVKEAMETGVENLVSTCPFCYRNLSDALEELNSEMKMIDLVQLIYDSLNRK